MGAFGGRMDHTLAAIHVLTKYSYIIDNPNTMITLMDKNSLILLLKKGTHNISISKKLVASKGCGFFPISERVEYIKTSGLKWNMGNPDDYYKTLDWKEFISSSNEIVDD